MNLLTEWDGWTRKYLARSHGVQTKRSEVPAPWPRTKYFPVRADTTQSIKRNFRILNKSLGARALNEQIGSLSKSLRLPLLKRSGESTFRQSTKFKFIKQSEIQSSWRSLLFNFSQPNGFVQRDSCYLLCWDKQNISERKRMPYTLNNDNLIDKMYNFTDEYFEDYRVKNRNISVLTEAK